MNFRNGAASTAHKVCARFEDKTKVPKTLALPYEDALENLGWLISGILAKNFNLSSSYWGFANNKRNVCIYVLVLLQVETIY